MRPMLILVMLLLAAAPALGQDPAEVAQRALDELLRAGEILRQPAVGANERATAERLCDSACERYQWVLANLAELPQAERAEAGQHAYYNSACARALQGHDSAAILLLERALDAGYDDWSAIKNDADLSSLREHERFKWLVRSAWVDSNISNLYVLGFQAGQALDAGRARGGSQLDAVCLRGELMLELAEHLYGSDLSKRTITARLNYQMACARALQGRRREALELLEQACGTGLVDPRGVGPDPDLESLRDEPVFKRLLTRQLRRWASPAKESTPLLLDWTWTFSEDLSLAKLEEQEGVARIWAQTLWRVSEGNVRLARVTLRDRAAQVGELHTPRGAVDRAMLSDETYAMTSAGVLLIPGSCGAFTFVHEVGHLLFWLPEEYDTPQGCPCAQAGERGRLTWCHADSHAKEQAALGKPPCWDTIRRRFPGLRHPGPGGDMPPVDVILDDR